MVRRALTGLLTTADFECKRYQYLPIDKSSPKSNLIPCFNFSWPGVIIYNTVKSVSVSEMQGLDRRAIEELGIPSIVLMENAGRCVSEVAIQMLGGAPGKKIAVFCGTGNNGGDGFVAARYLVNKGAEVSVYIVGDKTRIKNDAKVNLNILEKMRLLRSRSLPRAIARGSLAMTGVDLIIDAIFGIGLKGKVKEPAKGIIAGLNKNNAPIISVDVPSGLDADTGEVLGKAIKATKTVTMQFPKKGFCINQGPEHVGKVVAVDIGIPEELCAA